MYRRGFCLAAGLSHASSFPVVDRDTLIGIVLITLIMVVWMYWYSPPPQPPGQQGADTTATDTTLVDTSRADSLRAGGTEQDAAPSSESDTASRAARPESDLADRGTTDPAQIDLPFQTPQEGPGRTIVVENDLLTAKLSTHGATLTSFKLKEYKKFDQETPVQLVDTSRTGTISLGFYTPSNQLVNTRSLYFETETEQDTLHASEEPVTLTFRLPFENGGAIQQTYTFEPGEYEVGMNVEFLEPRVFTDMQGYEVSWNGGLPFTESDPTNEAQAAGAYARTGGEITSITLGDQEEAQESFSGTIDWTAVKNKFFTAVMIPEGETEGAELSGQRVGELESPTLWEDYTTRLLVPNMPEEPDHFDLYVGPIEYDRVSAYGLNLYGMVDYGWSILEWFTRPLATWVIIPTFHFFSRFIENYGLIIILFGVLVKFLLYPLTKKSYRSMAKMSDLQPKMKEIQEKYEDKPQKQQKEMMKLYQEAGVNPLGGCLPMLLQFPVIIALWRFFPSAIEIRQESFLWAQDLSAPDVILQLPFTIPFYGDYVAGFTLLMGLSMVFTMRMQTGASGAGGNQMKALQYIFPIMIFAIFNRFASGLSLYYLIYNLVTAGQQKYIKWQLDQEEDDEAPSTGKNVQKGRAQTAKT